MVYEEPDSLFAIDPTFRCPNCNGNLVFRGTKDCWSCINGGADGLQDLLKNYPKKATIKKVEPTSLEIMQAQKNASGNLPPLK